MRHSARLAGRRRVPGEAASTHRDSPAAAHGGQHAQHEEQQQQEQHADQEVQRDQQRADRVRPWRASVHLLVTSAFASDNLDKNE